jgi:hypothetical protein
MVVDTYGTPSSIAGPDDWIDVGQTLRQLGARLVQSGITAYSESFRSVGFVIPC